MKTLSTILKDNWEWRAQIFQLALFELKKRAQGAALGWIWLFAKPLVYIVVFWLVLAIGLRAERSVSGDNPYFIWLMSGVIPWFYMSSMIGGGSDVLHHYRYLVNKVKFPISGISTLYSISSLIENLMLVVILMVIYSLYGMAWDVYLIQIPIAIVLMFVFWTMVSVMLSQLSGISKDFCQLIRAFQQPLFWLSGILYEFTRFVAAGYGWISNVMLFNPITFFVTIFRDATYYKVWFWSDPAFVGAFAVVFLLTLVVMCFVYAHFNEEVADVL